MLRKLLAGLALFTMIAAPVPALADEYPSRVVRIVVPFAPGGPTDVLGRLLAERLQAELGQPFIIDNRPGGGGTVGTAFVGRADPDGYTLLLVASGHAIAPSVFANLPFDPVNDFASVGLMGTAPYVLVAHPSLGVQTAQQLIELGKRRSEPLFYATPGAGTANHLAVELLRQLTGVRVEHVAYTGAGPATQALLRGDAAIMINNLTSAIPHVRAGSLTAIALTGRHPNAAFPGLPVLADTVPGFEATAWYGIMAPARTPRPVIDRLAAAMERIVGTPDFRQRLATLGVDATSVGPAETDAFIAAEIAKWADVARRANIRPE